MDRGPAIDAVVRAVVDALDGVLWYRRSQVADLRSEKSFTESEEYVGTLITVTWTS